MLLVVLSRRTRNSCEHHAFYTRMLHARGCFTPFFFQHVLKTGLHQLFFPQKALGTPNGVDLTLTCAGQVLPAGPRLKGPSAVPRFAPEIVGRVAREAPESFEHHEQLIG